MKLSIVIPLFNKEEYVAETLQSLVDQTLLPYELIIVDDKSTDNSLQVAKQFIDSAPPSFKNTVKIEFIASKENRGIGYTRNVGFAQTSGDYVCFLDADDLYMPTLIEKTSKLISSESLDFVVFGIQLFPSGITYPNMGTLMDHLTAVDHETYRLDHPMKTVSLRTFVMGLGSNVIAKRSDMESEKVYEDGRLGEGTDYWYRVMKIAYQRAPNCIALLLGNYILVREVEDSASRKKYDHWTDVDYPPTLIRYEKSKYLYDKLIMDVMGRRWLKYSGGGLKTRKQRTIFKLKYRRLYRKQAYYWILRKIHANRPPEHLNKS
ncbi:MAG: glycosyltransferase family 2 protein [Crocinitomicaceae bacterium]